LYIAGFWFCSCPIDWASLTENKKAPDESRMRGTGQATTNGILQQSLTTKNHLKTAVPFTVHRTLFTVSMRPKWSQNFLVDKNIAKLCVKALDLTPDNEVLEIGPGKGVLTQLLVQQAKKVTAVEIDSELFTVLKDQFKSFKNFSVINQDFLDVRDWGLGVTPHLQPQPFKIIGNLPYAVVSPILQKVLSWSGWSMAVFMVQKEVGDRIMAQPGNKEYGILSVSVQSRSQVEKIRDVPSSCFKPAPKVTSTVLRLVPLLKPLVTPKNEEHFFRVLRGSFAQRRKKLVNSLSHSLDLPAAKIISALTHCNISVNARAETLSVLDFKHLSDILYYKEKLL
jgi:16S rRNA (adenine1518-N6/adenine1519-N6)-dimethyltransferase